MTPYEAASLWAQWVGSISAALAVVVAAVFGYLTLLNNRRSKDAQQRASLAAASGEGASPSQGVLPGSPRSPGPRFEVRHKVGETWLLINDGPGAAYDVEISGLTDLDKQRLQSVAPAPETLAAGQSREFILISRLTRSGPANIVVSFRLQPGESGLRRVLQVPSR